MTSTQLTLDDRDVPRTVDAARAMTFQQIESAVLKVALDLEDMDEVDFLAEITRDGDTTDILSDLGVDIYQEMVGHLFPNHRLRDVPVDNWASLAGVAHVVFDIFQSGGNDGPANS